MQREKRVYLVLLLFLFIFGCNVPTSTSIIEEKPASKADFKTIKREVMYSARYKLSIKDKGIIHTVNCKGKGIIMDTYTDQTIEMRGTADCGLFGGKMDLSQLNQSLEEVDETKYKDAKFNGIISRVPNPKKSSSGKVGDGFAYFTPPKPIILNPLLSTKKVNDLIGQTITEENHVIVGSEGRQISDSGDISLVVHSLDSNIPSDANQSTAPLRNKGKVVVYTINTTGFNKVPQKGGYMLFNSRKMWMGTNPILIYKMEVKSLLKDVVSEKELAEKKDNAVNNPFLKVLSDIPVFGSLINLFVNLATSGLEDKEIVITFTLEEYIPKS